MPHVAPHHRMLTRIIPLVVCRIIPPLLVVIFPHLSALGHTTAAAPADSDTDTQTSAATAAVLLQQF